MFQFANEKYLWFLLAIPLLIVMYRLILLWRHKQLQRFGDIKVINSLMTNLSRTGRKWKFALMLFVLTMLIVALARPQFGSKLQDVKREGVELIIAIDVSNSMLTKDILPNRLERAKKSVQRLIGKLQDDRLGLIVFAGDAYVQLPVTNDYASARMFLATISPDIVPKQGTAIGSAIDLASRSFSSDNQSSKVLIIITDGENHEDNPVTNAEEAYENGIVIHTIGMGLPEGKPIPGVGGQGFMKDKSGNVVMSKLDEETLSRIAAAGHGTYVRSTNTNTGLDMIVDEINKMEKTSISQKKYSEYDEKFVLFAWIALVVLLVEILVSERKIIRKKKTIKV